MPYQPEALAGQPTRSSGSITVSWGLITIPLSIYSSTEAVNVSRKEFIEGNVDHPSGRQMINKTTGDVVTQDQIVKMAQATNGEWVTLDDDEIAACAFPKGLADIISFVPFDEVFKYIPEDMAQVRPPSTKGKVDAGVVRSFTLFLEAMNRKSVCALIRFAIRGGARYGLITPDANLVYLKTADQIRQSMPLPSVEIDAKLMQLAEQLLDQVGIEAPTIVNDTAERVREYVDSKASTGVRLETPVAVHTELLDLAALLAGSLK